MKERPMIFTASSVRGILAEIKTQTRRIVKPQPFDIGPVGGTFAAAWNEKTAEAYEHFHCPYGQPGDRLWVRETFFPCPIGQYATNCKIPKQKPDKWTVLYPADGDGISAPLKWKPSIFMPRWASRITLEITGVRVEWLQKISEADALAEGVTIPSYDKNLEPVTIGGCTSGAGRIAYKELWESINGPNSWHANPWVWVIEFRKI